MLRIPYHARFVRGRRITQPWRHYLISERAEVRQLAEGGGAAAAECEPVTTGADPVDLVTVEGDVVMACTR